MLEFYRNLDFNNLFWVFFMGSFVGVIVETIWCIIRHKRIESRKGLVYGPFNLVYGFGAMLMTLSLSWLEGQRDLYVFVFGAILGGFYEYMCSLLQEKLFGSVSWDYKNIPLSLNGRTNLLYCFFWGLLSVLWVRDIYPAMMRLFYKIPEGYEYTVTICLLLFMSYNTLVSACAVYRMNKRLCGEEASNAFWKHIDRRFPDERIRRIYPNMQFGIENKEEEKQDEKVMQIAD